MDSGSALNLIKNRRSVRVFDNKKVNIEELIDLIEAAIWAPSGSNIQAWFYGIVDEEDILEKIKSFSPGLFGDPPNLIILCTDNKTAFKKGGKMGKEVVIYDIAMAAENILLLATAKNLATCCVKSFNKRAVNKILKLPEYVSAELIIAVGFAQRIPVAPKRKQLNQITFINEWEGKLNE